MKFRIRVRLKTLSCLLGIFSFVGLIFLLDHSMLSRSHSKRDEHEVIAKKNLQLRRINVRSLSEGRSHEDPFPVTSPKGNSVLPIKKCNAGQPGCKEDFFIRYPNGKGKLPYVEVMRNLSHVRANAINGSCNQKCRLERRRALTRPLIENMELPKDWTVSEDLLKRFQYRKQHVKQVCDKKGLSVRSPSNQPNTWEYLINKKHNLVWCSIFKAASSTWFFNFNLLAGYTESYLLGYRNTPIALARLKYPRPTVQELDEALNSTNKPLTFMIVRHPLERLVSGYRDKFLSNVAFYRNISRKIISNYPQYGPPVVLNTSNPYMRIPRLNSKSYGPSFKQFVEHIIDSWKNNVKLDEHWERMERFCTPCVVDIDIYAKVETLDEDGNFIIFTSGIEKVIAPKRINRSKNGPTDSVVSKFLCSLTSRQMKELVMLYKLDLEMFEYDYQKYLDCTRGNTEPWEAT